jgi:diketogulonate reductase-like aldo/keto reductase
VPRIGFGTAALGDGTVQAVHQALEVGYRLFDCAQAREWYREDLVGQVTKQWEEENGRSLFLVTKIHPRDFGVEKTRSAVQESIRLLGHIDLLLIHSPNCWEGMCP